MRIETIRIGFFLSVSNRSKRAQIKTAGHFHAQPIFNSHVHRFRLIKSEDRRAQNHIPAFAGMDGVQLIA
ncbi:hypothetical protein [Paraburkholderia aromaticivorans]|uniref:hypothetical protein n=1 Tax=Paraburkholderia aromaticivorans TaxID=2026199 RepID=UPI001456248D|nr:hypothetical protein [Paraburkholderia aromaticivorans]